MASKVFRCIQVWLILLLCWFVLRSDPVTQDSDVESDDVPSEKVNLGFTEQHATPSLVSIHHTETIIPENFDQSTLVTRPPIAPATPWDDTQVLSTVSEQSPKHDSSTEHEIVAEEKILHRETPSSSENLQNNPSLDDSIQDAIEVDTSGNAIEDDHIKKLVKSLDPVESVNDVQDSTSETVVQSSEIDSLGKLENVENNSEDGTNEGQAKMGELSEPERTIISENEVKVTSSHNSDKLPVRPQAYDLPDGEFGDSQKTEDQNGLEAKQDVNNEGTHDGLEGTQEDVDGVNDGLGGTQEDMPSFKEWSQKFLAQEEEKKVAQINEKGTLDLGTQQKKKIVDRKQNNYASVDCGANIPEKNSEAQNAHSILLENKDLYMLNPCSANIWFVVELCDHVQVTSLQLANFEMFSSTIEKFQVSFSTRYPTRDWSQQQVFVAKPEKSIQTFTIDPIFAKYIKVEQLSHHGSEHYCPWSLLRVYGNSMVEEYEEHESPQDRNPSNDEDGSTSSNSTEDKQIHQGILRSATDAVLNFVKETAKKLVPTEHHTSSSSNTTNATKYLENNSTQPLPPKTIVQLMPREDYEASCHGDDDDIPMTCLSENGCTSTKYIPHSYQTFLEIVRNICNRNTKTAEACFTNFSNILVANITSKDKNLSKNANGRNFSSAINGARSKDLKKDDRKITPEEENSKQIDRGSDTESDTSEKQSKEEPGDVATSSQTAPSETSSFEKSVHIDIQSSYDTPIASTVSPSSVLDKRLGGSSIQASAMESSVTSSICDFDCASAPTPLAQPPLAVNNEANLAERPTQKHDSNLKETVAEANLDTFVSSQGIDSGEGLAYVGDSPTSTSDQSSDLSSSKMAESKTSDSEKISTQSEGGSSEAANGDAVVHEGSPGSNTEYEQGHEASHRVNKGYEDVPNPYVDVLKITLTDAETKEGTAEPEQADEETVSDVEIQLNQTVESSVEEEKEVKKVDVDIGDSMEKEIKEVETHKEKPVDAQVDSSLVDQGLNTDTSVHHVDTDVETELTGSSLVNTETNVIKEDASEGQCEMKDVTKLSEDVSLSSNDPGPTLHVEQGPIPTAASVGGSTYGKKESIFVALSRKIKALEQNVTMTNLFLEELSQRYRKSMDEVQKKMEKKFSKNLKLLTKVNLSQNSTIIALASRIGHMEEKLKEATSRLKAVNQEVVERHVIGMCLQFLFVTFMWFVLRRVGGRTQQPATQARVGNGHLMNGTALCNGTDYRQINGNFEDIEHEKVYLEELITSKPLTPEAISETKRRKRRKNRPNSVASDQALDQASSQNIVSRTAGLLFHTPGSQDNIPPATKGSGSLRSCSADSLSSLTQDERKSNSKKCAFSPKPKKVSQKRGDADDGGMKSGASETRNIKERHHTARTKLVRSKSSGECYENKLAISDIALSTSSPKKSLGNARCSLQSTSEPLKGQKSRWIWGLG